MYVLAAAQETWTAAWVRGAFPIPDNAPHPQQCLGKPTGRNKTLLASIHKCAGTHFFFFSQPCKLWENAPWGHKAQATNLQTTTLLCFEFF